VKKFVAALALMLSLLTGVNAEVTIPAEDHVANGPGGFCMWCSLEVVGRAQHVRALYGLRDARMRETSVGAAYEPVVRGRLDALGVKYRWQRQRTRDFAFLERALAAGHAVVSGVRLRGPVALHAVVLTDLTKDHALVVDSNHVGVVLEIPRDVFDRAWDGTAVEILGGP
jgi:hypothetical protein